MRCDACGAVHGDSQRYCDACGARIAVTCRFCSSPNQLDAAFCSQCGAAIKADARSLRAEAAAESGELKQPTVLFADIVSSTEMVAHLDAEQAMESLQRILAVMRHAIERYGGTVVRLLGDGLMALFGAPRALEGHAVLACQAALALQEAFPARPGMPALRVGLHSGEVVADSPEAEPMQERTAHGLTIHVAHRIMAMAEPGAVLISEACRRLVQAHCEVRPSGTHLLRGVPEPMGLYALVGMTPTINEWDFRAARLSSFRGREQETGLLRASLLAAEAGTAQFIGIAGPPGVGKSRLCYEFGNWCRQRGVEVYTARAQLYGHAMPLSPIMEVLRQIFCGTKRESDSGAMQQWIAARLSALQAGFGTDLGLVCSFLGIVSPEAAQAMQLGPKLRLLRFQEILRELLMQAAAPASLILIEDVHWLDSASEDVVAVLAAAATGTRTMLLLNYRPGYRSPRLEAMPPREITLGEIGTTETWALVCELVGNRTQLTDLRARVAKRSGGNPFFAEELVRSLVESGTLMGAPGDYDLTAGIDIGRLAPSLPPTLQAVVGARIDRLATSGRRLLHICAVIGKEVPLGVLERLAKMPAHWMEAGLTQLCEAGLLQAQPGPEELVYAFRHPLFQEVAYGTQLRARRAQLHAAVAEVMKQRYGERLDEFAGLLAHHYEVAGQPREAAIFGARAARWVGLTSPTQAIQHWRIVRALLNGLDRDPEIDPLRMMASAQIAYMGWRDGLKVEDAQPFIREAIAWAREVDARMVPLLLVVDARIAASSGGAADTYAARVKEALALLPPDNHDGRAAILYGALCQAYSWGGLLREALAANDTAIPVLSLITVSDHEFYGFNVGRWVRSMRAWLLARLHRFDEAEECCREIGLEYGASTDPTVTIITHLALFDIACLKGDLGQARMHRDAIEWTASRYGTAYVRAYAFRCAAAYNMLAGDMVGAVSQYMEALHIVRGANVAMNLEAELLAGLAESHRQVGAVEQALVTAQEAMEIARIRCTRLAECGACITLGAARLDAGAGAEEVVALFDRAAELMVLSGSSIHDEPLRRELWRLSVLTH
jgi:class 3 adenylate cyclase/tetratricopeptide (TPR) repeat protein